MPRDRNIAYAADKGDLAAVRGHLRRDRGCLDQLFDGGVAALHWAAQNDDGAAIVTFLLAQGAAVDVVTSNGPGPRGPPLGAAGCSSDCSG